MAAALQDGRIVQPSTSSKCEINAVRGRREVRTDDGHSGATTPTTLPTTKIVHGVQQPLELQGAYKGLPAIVGFSGVTGCLKELDGRCAALREPRREQARLVLSANLADTERILAPRRRPMQESFHPFGHGRVNQLIPVEE